MCHEMEKVKNCWLNLLTVYLQENSTSSKGKSRIISTLTKKFESNCLFPIPLTKKKND